MKIRWKFVVLLLWVCFAFLWGCDSSENAQINLEERKILWTDCYNSVDQIFSLSFENVNFTSHLQQTLFICKDRQFKMANFSSYDDVIDLQGVGENLLEQEVDFVSFLEKNQETFLQMLQPLENLSEKELMEKNISFTQFMQRFLTYEEEIEKAYQVVLDVQDQFLKKYELEWIK